VQWMRGGHGAARWFIGGEIVDLYSGSVRAGSGDRARAAHREEPGVSCYGLPLQTRHGRAGHSRRRLVSVPSNCVSKNSVYPTFVAAASNALEGTRDRATTAPSAGESKTRSAPGSPGARAAARGGSGVRPLGIVGERSTRAVRLTVPAGRSGGDDRVAIQPGPGPRPPRRRTTNNAGRDRTHPFDSSWAQSLACSEGRSIADHGTVTVTAHLPSGAPTISTERSQLDGFRHDCSIQGVWRRLRHAQSLAVSAPIFRCELAARPRRQRSG